MKTENRAFCFAAGATLLPQMPDAATLPDAAQTALFRALDDEYHAEAVYVAAMQGFGVVRPFFNIIKAERTREAALFDLMNTYGVAVRENAWAVGTKPLPAFQRCVGAKVQHGN